MPPASAPVPAALASRWFEVERIAEGVVCVRRTAERMEAADVPAAYEPVLDALAAAGTEGLWVDLRAAPGRNDDAYETAVAPYRRRLLASAGRVAVLVRTRVGALQVARHAREDGLDVFVTDDPAAARAHALGAAAGPRPPGPGGADPADR